MDRAIFTLRQLALVAGDLTVFLLSLALAVWLRNVIGEAHLTFSSHLPSFSAIFFFWLVAFYVLDLYDLTATRSAIGVFRNLVSSMAAAAALAIAFFYLTPGIGIAPKTTLFLDLATTTVLLLAWRLVYAKFLRSSKLRMRLVFVGLTDEARELIRELGTRPELGLDVVGAVAFDGSDAPGIPVRRSTAGFAEYLKTERVSTVVLATSPRSHPELARELYDCIFLKISFVDIVNFYEQITRRVPISAISHIWFLENLQESRKRLYEIAKRGLDFAGALALGTVTVVLTPFIAAAIFVTDRGPIFFSQERLGRDGHVFRVRKFRTMIVDAEKDGARFAEKNDSRVTAFGHFLRVTRLDELPQCLNILLGEMSFIGPRPERPEFAKTLTMDMPYYPMRLLVRPGLSGWAQVSYPYYATPEEHRLKLQYDLYYVKNRSLVLDSVTALRTLNTILHARGQ